MVTTAGDRVPVPYRITAALDLADLHGPAVDAALEVREPTVDNWEAGTLRPSPADVERLSKLTGFAVEWFYRPAPDPFVGFLCSRGRGGCELVDERPDAPVISLFPAAAPDPVTLW
ncbi:hypothetical protein [Rhodococcoides fascians]|uniref:hypothetical protein n=1 Tax=Rhodococcoides fascians TaxID=1828 RepID=UPI000568B8BE|nr:hypothetical protein [Rhodococcus fascians]